MPKGIQGMINLNSNMVAPQVNSDNNVDASNWKIVKSKRQLREERKSNYNLNFPPLKSASSLGSKTYKNKSPSIKTTKYPNEPAHVTIPVAIVLLDAGKCLATTDTGIPIAVEPKPIPIITPIVKVK